MRFNADKVIIDGKEYLVEKYIYSQARGHEYLLSLNFIRNCRTCHAEPKNTKCVTGGETLIYK